MNWIFKKIVIIVIEGVGIQLKNTSSLPGKLQSLGIFQDECQNYKIGKIFIIFNTNPSGPVHIWYTAPRC